MLTYKDLITQTWLNFYFISRPKVHELGNVPGTELYEDIKDYKKVSKA